MSTNSVMTESRPTWLRVRNTALHVVPAILGSHHTTSVIARSMPTTPCTICLWLGRHRSPVTEPSPVMTIYRGSSRQTGEHVASDGCARRMGRVDKPLAAEDDVIQRSRDPQERGESSVRPVIRGGLRGVGPHRGPFGGGVTDDVDPMGDVGLRAESSFKGGGVEGCREPVDLAGQGYRATDRVTWHGRVQHPRSLSQLCRTHSDMVSLHMIAVPVAAIGVIRQEDLDGLLDQDVGEQACGLFHVRLDEPCLPWWIRQGLWPQPAVCIAEVFHSCHLQRACAFAQLVQPSLAEATVGHKVAGGLTLLAVGCHDQDDPVPLRGGTS